MGRRSQIARAFWPILFWAAACTQPAPESPKPAPLRAGVVGFANELGHALKADYLPAAPGKPTLALMHGLGAGRGEWAVWRDTLAAAGIGLFAFDARGHGDSGGPSWRSYHTPEAWRALRGDFHAARRRLAEGGVSPILFGGASVGANIALLAAAEDARVPAVLLLSPGLNYPTGDMRGDFQACSRAVIAAAAPDDAAAWQTLAWIKQAVGTPNWVLLAAPKGHGAALLRDPRFAGRLAANLSSVSFSETQASP